LTKKLRFTVEDAKMIDENPNSNFAILDLDFFASGENLHDMYVSEDTLKKTADTIKNCPIVWEYDPELDDIGTHDAQEVPCGFVPESSQVKSKKTDDGRTMLSVIAYVWKKYTGELLSFFKRDGGSKPVSVEMSVYDSKPIQNGLTELLDFKYEAITVLGTYVTPAIPGAAANVLSFADMKKEYNKALKEEFPDVAMVIPADVKDNAKTGLALRLQVGATRGTASGIATARYLTSKEKAKPEKIKQMAAYFSEHKKSGLASNGTPENIDWLLWGGTAGMVWAQSIADELNEKENEKMRELVSTLPEKSIANETIDDELNKTESDRMKELIVTFPYKSMKDANPALKGIEPPISVAQANAIAKQADAIGSDEKKNGWAIAISSFKKTHKVENGHWVEKDAASMAEEEKVVENAEPEKVVENTESVVENATEKIVENATEEEKEFAKEDLGKSEAIETDKSKEAVSNTAWGDVDKTALMHKVLGASNYKSLVDDVYLIVESGWEDHPSQSLKYPVMQEVGGKFVYNSGALVAALGRAKGQGETAAVSKAEGIRKKLGLEPEKEEEKMADEVEKKEEEMAAKPAEGSPAEEKKESPAEEKKEQEEGKGDEKKFEFPKNFDWGKMSQMFAEEDGEDPEAEEEKMAKLECAKAEKGEFCEPGIIMSGMYAKMCKLAAKLAKKEEEDKTMMAENEELKKFKADIEAEKKEFEVEKTLNEMAEKVVLPDEAKKEMAAKADEFAYADLEQWKQYVKAKSFDFAIREHGKEEVKKLGNPWATGKLKPNSDIWAGTK
jgi:hypothetical protein